MKYLSSILLFLFSSSVWACPYCAGTDQGGKGMTTVIVLGIFILAAYIPFFLIFRKIIKLRNLNNVHKNGTFSPSRNSSQN